MYLQRVELKHIKMFADFEWELPKNAKPAGWHVLLGDNGSGKTTLLRAIAMALMGEDMMKILSYKVSFDRYAMASLRHDVSSIHLSISHKEQAVFSDRFSQGRRPAKSLELRLEAPYMGSFAAPIGQDVAKTIKQDTSTALRAVWGNASGWFSASFGAFRRFTGGDKDYERHFVATPRLARHLTLFGEDVALTEVAQWIKSLDYERLKDNNGGSSRAAQLLHRIMDFINQDNHLPYNVRVESVDVFGLWFVGNNVGYWMDELSDGYRSVLSITLELIRQLAAAFPDQDIFEEDEATGVIRVMPPGVVLIDEVDVHLHPTWQQRVGQWFTKYFPNIQFIVATHSPLVCQAAVNGTIFRLPTPGTDETPRFVEGEERARLLYGNILDAYGTEAFGRVTRSVEGRERSKRLAWLNTQVFVRDLTHEEEAEREALRAATPTTKEQLPSGEELVAALQTATDAAKEGVAAAVEQAKPRKKRAPKKAQEG